MKNKHRIKETCHHETFKFTKQEYIILIVFMVLFGSTLVIFSMM